MAASPLAAAAVDLTTPSAPPARAGIGDRSGDTFAASDDRIALQRPARKKITSKSRCWIDAELHSMQCCTPSPGWSRGQDRNSTRWQRRTSDRGRLGRSTRGDVPTECSTAAQPRQSCTPLQSCTRRSRAQPMRMDWARRRTLAHARRDTRASASGVGARARTDSVECSTAPECSTAAHGFLGALP